MNDNHNSIIKFAIGVTGHRDYDPKAQGSLEDSVSSCLADIQGGFSHAPVEVICGMAEGADTLVAQIALDRGLNVHAILPMPLDLYRQDFSEHGLKSLDELLANPNLSVTEIPVAREDELDRDRQYVLLKDYIVRRSNVLLALWMIK